MKKALLFFLLILFLVLHAGANEVVLEHDGEKNYISLRSDTPVEISGFNFQLNLSPETRIDSLALLPPFNGAVNIQNEKGYARIAGYTAGSSSSGRFAEILYSGDGKFDIIVIELFDRNLNPVVVTNLRRETTTPAPTPSLLPYNPPPQYQPPGGRSPINPVITYPAQPEPNSITAEITAPVARETLNPEKTQIPGQQNRTQIAGTLSPPAVTVPTETGTMTGEFVHESQPIPSYPVTSQTRRAPLSPVLAPVALVVLILLGRKR